MTAADFRRLALTLPGAEESSHMGAADFRVGGHIFATLASEAQGFGNLMLTPGVQAAFLADAPHIFLPIHGGWGRMGMTLVHLDIVDEPTLKGALTTAYRNVTEKLKDSKRKPVSSSRTKPMPSPRNKPRL